MKLKGTCKVTIRDAETGRIVREESHSNTITPALMKIFEKGNVSGCLDYTKVTPLYSKLLGGVCCWNDVPSASDVYLPNPKDMQIIAHAGQHTYADAEDDRTRGNYSSGSPIRQDLKEIGYKWIWTFDRSQGNGLIKSVSLCHSDVGDYYNQLHTGALDFCPVDDVSNYVINANSFTYDDHSPDAGSLPALCGIANQNKIPIGFYGDINHVVSFEVEETAVDEATAEIYGGDWRSGQFNLYISEWTGDGLWLWNNLADVTPEIKIVVPVKWQWANSNPGQSRCPYWIAYDETNGHVYLITGGSLNSIHFNPMPDPPYTFTWYSYGSDLVYYDVNLSNGNVTQKSVNVGTNAQLCFRTPQEIYETVQLHVDSEGCIVLPLHKYELAGDGLPNYQYATETAIRAAKINLRTAAVVDYLDGNIEASSGNERNAVNGSLNLYNGRMMFLRSFIENRSSSTSIDLNITGIGSPIMATSKSYVDTITPSQSSFGTAWRTNRLYCASKEDSLIQFATLCVGNGASVNKLRGCILNKMYMASVFELNEPLIKTGSQTMTVEYTLYQEEES